ncbi:hypothetical protein Tco_0791211 [Tanacetum coccineum]
MVKNGFIANKAEKYLKVKQRKSPLSYHGFVYAETQFEEPPKVPLKRRNVNLKDHLEQVQVRNYDRKLWNSLPMKYFCYVKQAMLKFEKQMFSKIELNRGDLFRMSFEQSINERVRNRLSEEFEPLVKNVNLQLNCFEKSLVKEMKDDLKYVVSLEDEFDETCLILDIQQEFFKTQFESAISDSHSHIKVVLERQLDHKIQDSNAEKDQFLEQIASLESKLASQDLISTQKEYSELRTSYNALKEKFDALNQDKGKSQISKISTPKYEYVGLKTQDRKKAKYDKDDQFMMKDLEGKVKRQRQRKGQNQDHRCMIGTRGTSFSITRTRLKIKTRSIKDQRSRSQREISMITP